MSKYADLAHKIVDMVHATHKEEVRKARTEEKTKKAEEKKLARQAAQDAKRYVQLLKGASHVGIGPGRHWVPARKLERRAVLKN